MVSSFASSCIKRRRCMLHTLSAEKLPGQHIQCPKAEAPLNESQRQYSPPPASTSELAVTEAFSLKSVFHGLLDKGRPQSPDGLVQAVPAAQLCKGWLGQSHRQHCHCSSACLITSLDSNPLFLLDTGLALQLNKPTCVFKHFQSRIYMTWFNPSTRNNQHKAYVWLSW